MFLTTSSPGAITPFVAVFRGNVTFFALVVLLPHEENQERFSYDYTVTVANGVPLVVKLRGVFGNNGDAIPRYGDAWQSGKIMPKSISRHGALMSTLNPVSGWSSGWWDLNPELRKRAVKDTVADTWSSFLLSKESLNWVQDRWEDHTKPFLASTYPIIDNDVREFYLGGGG